MRVRERVEVALTDVQPQHRRRQREQQARRQDERDDRLAHRRAGRCAPTARCPRAGRGRGSAVASRFTLSPRMASTAGRNVSEPTTEMKTTEIVPIAIERNSGSSSRNSPAIEIMTARPEKNTARPAVLEATSDGRQLVAPAPLGAEARDHEQRVVDRDGQPDQDDQLAGVWADRRDELAVQAQDPERRQQRRDRQDERHDRRDGRTERDQQDHERQRDRDPQRRVEVVVDELEMSSLASVLLRAWIGQVRVVARSSPRRPARARGVRTDLVAVAGDPGDDPDRRPVRRDEPALRRAP